MIGFITAAFSTGLLVESRKNPGFLWLSLSMSIGAGTLFILGVLWFSLFVGGLMQAFFLGLIPFIPGDFVKIIAASFMSTKVRKMIGKPRRN